METRAHNDGFCDRDTVIFDQIASCTYVNYFQSGSPIHLKILEIVTRIFRYEMKFQHCFSPVNRQTIRTSHSCNTSNLYQSPEQGYE
ncbi:hypothetical protein EPI10_028185 [Gossypium australe]|uniref:Uncharacterized protein n=1 Tax=Gossypium australe TaxID=47621 RepID=A0A5B6UU69_9ROSI|nr:hypothetical protein EPI10_028185 [Gossypium australe]